MYDRISENIYQTNNALNRPKLAYKSVIVKLWYYLYALPIDETLFNSMISNLKNNTLLNEFR